MQAEPRPLLRVLIVDDVSSTRQGLCAQFGRLSGVLAEEMDFGEATNRSDWDDVDWVVSDAAFDLRHKPEFEDQEPTPAVPLIETIRSATTVRPRIVVITSCPATWNEPVVRRRLAEVDPEAHYIERAEFQVQLDALLQAVELADASDNDLCSELDRLLRGLPDVGNPASLDDLGVTPTTRLNPLLAELRDLLVKMKGPRERRKKERIRIALAAKYGLAPVRKDGAPPENSSTPSTSQFETVVARSKAMLEWGRGQIRDR
ncbi:MAG: hypothetical protein ACT4OX_01665 [Actinomycetota bacterium]